VLPPLTVFSAFVVSFLTVTKSPLVVGVNLVAPENDPVALRDYWAHMVMVSKLIIHPYAAWLSLALKASKWIVCKFEPPA
jgi:hypothetical protein